MSIINSVKNYIISPIVGAKLPHV